MKNITIYIKLIQWRIKMNTSKEENAFSADAAFDEILEKLASIPWLKEYAVQLPADLIMKILQFFGSKYEIKQLNDCIVRFKINLWY